MSVGHKGPGRGGRSLWLRAVLALALAAGVASAWYWTPLQDYSDTRGLASAAAQLRANPYADLIVLGGYVIGGLLFLPVTALVAATALTFEPVHAFGLAMAGCLASALAGFAVGYVLGAEPLRRLGGRAVDRVSRGASRHGFMVVTALRLLPVAHFSMTNLASGASQVRLRDYIAGTLLGMLPGNVAIVTIAHQARRVLTEPSAGSVLLLTGIAAVSIGLLYLLRRWMGRRYAAGRNGRA